MDKKPVITVHVLNTELLQGKEEAVVSKIAPCYAAKYERMRHPGSKGQELGAGYLLAAYLGVTTDDELIFNENGKPFLRGRDLQTSALEFSLSHTGNYVVLAIAKDPVGIDIERVDRIKLSVLERVLPEVMYEKLAADDGPEREKRLSMGRAWTTVEAVMKADGRGLFDDLRKDPFFMERWHVESFPVGEEYMVSCASKSPFSLELIKEEAIDISF
jgi:phosphopantetheinyl transferase